MKPTRVRLFIKPYCPWCSKAKDWLDARGVEYEVLNVMADDQAYDEMERLSGQTLAPTIEVDGQVLGDFGPPEIEKWWKKNGWE
jgi:glutaredoxin 3